MSRVLLAMSGGVDSSACAVLLKEAGHEVVGVFMRNGVSAGAPMDGPASKSCCSASDARDAAAVAERLGIPFYSVDYADEFAALMDGFAAEYRAGRTPNPCVLCNTRLKFGHLFELADSVGAEQVATGHYARVDAGRLYRAKDRDKDQTYYLFGIERAALGRVLFPIGGMDKAEVRARAAAAGLRTAGKAESMEICFVTSGDYRDVVRARGGSGQPGVFVDEDGRVVGAHDGVDGFTVGQRRGLPAMGEPYYVRAIDPGAGVVTISRRAGLLQRRAALSGVRWLVDPPGPDGYACRIKIRARSSAVPGRVRPVAGAGGAGRAELGFADDVAAISPGQAAVFYQDDLVLGGGWLD